MARSVTTSAGSRRRGPVARPAVDERLVAPESGYEVVDGRTERVSPANEPHGSRHSKLAALLEAHVKPAFDAAVDLLTRAGETSDRAPDASVFARARDPQTGGRRIEELAFEVLDTERIDHATAKATELAQRGVRRVFAIDLPNVRVLEWRPRSRRWAILADDSRIADRTFAAAMPVAALVHATRADDAVAHALLAKRNPVLLGAMRDAKAEGKAEGRAEGRAEGKAEALLAVLAGRKLEVTAEQRAQIARTSDAATVDGWLQRAATCRDVAALLRARAAR